MDTRHIFVIFKLGRSGSTRLAQIINEHPECFCRAEILNFFGDTEAAHAPQTHIDSVLAGRTERNIGFTLNPGKQPTGSAFFDYRRHFADRKLVVFVLTRTNILHRALSMYVARNVGSHPGSRTSRQAGRLLDYVNGGIDIPRREIRALIRSAIEGKAACVNFAQAFAIRFEVPLIHVTYEGVFEGEHGDLVRVFAALGIADGFSLPDPAEKLLPPPEQYVRNYEQIAALCERIQRNAA